MVDPRILEKVKKCLSLSRSSNAHEAATALRQAQKLMAAHGLSEADVELGAIGEADVRSVASSTRVKVWEGTLARMVAEAFGCEVLWSERKNTYGAFIVVGPTAETMIASHTLTVLQRLVTKARAAFIAKQPAYLSRAEVTANGDAYCTGWVVAVQAELDRFAWTDSRRNALKAYIEGKNPNLRSSKLNDKGKHGDYAAARQGAQDGKQVRLRKAAGSDGVNHAALGQTQALTHEVAP